jgi:hypothetical protein
MKRIVLPVILASTLLAGLYFSPCLTHENKKEQDQASVHKEGIEEEEEEGGMKRREYELKMLRNPKTGLIPAGIHKKEYSLLDNIIQVQKRIGYRTLVNNTYESVGPSKTGGRTRAIKFDLRYDGSSNRVLLAAGVSGGIFRSTDGGNTWNFVHPPNAIRSVTCLAQDPREGNDPVSGLPYRDTWYAGTGEYDETSWSYTSFESKITGGYGMLKSTDNGLTWSPLPITFGTTSQHVLDNLWDYVFNVQVDQTGRVFAAILNNIVSSNNGGASFGYVLRSPVNTQSIIHMQTNIVISGNRYYASLCGRNATRDTVGVWRSTTDGLFGNWTRIAGGPKNAPDSVAGWEAYANDVVNGAFSNGWERMQLTPAPSNPDILYVLYSTAKNPATEPEGHLFRADFTGGTPTWSNRTINLKALQNGSQNRFLSLQVGYNMLLAVHPTDPNTVLVGGVDLFLSKNGFSTQGTYIGGRESSTYTDPLRLSHVDFHSYAFDPTNPNRLVVGNDGGLQVTEDINASSVAWNLFNNKYQTTQFYHVAIDPVAGSGIYTGGTQDNSTPYRDANGLLGPLPSDPNDHYILGAGDGFSVGLSGSTATQQILYGSTQLGNVFRYDFQSRVNSIINPTGTSNTGEFGTLFHLDPDNTNYLYYVNNNRLWRTNNAPAVAPGSGWTELTGIASTLSSGGAGNIFSLATTRGNYTTNSWLFIGTETGRIYRLKNPIGVGSATAPTRIDQTAGTTGTIRQIAVNPRNADTLLVVVSNYDVPSIFWTGNATAATPIWRSIEGNISLPSAKSCAIVINDNNAVEYYVGTSIGLFSTTAISGNSTNWTLEGPGILQGAIINDLKLRTSDNTLLIGTHGNGLFVTRISSITPVNNIVRNDRNFIKTVYPTLVNNQVNFAIGNLTGIKKITARIFSLSGSLMHQKEMGYVNGMIETNRLAPGNYILEITSDNGKHKQVQQFIKGF